MDDLVIGGVAYPPTIGINASTGNIKTTGNLTVSGTGTSTFGSGTNREPLSITGASTTDTIFHIINTSTNGVDWQLRSVGNAGSAGGVAGDLVFFCGGPFNASALKFNGTTGAATFGGAVTIGGNVGFYNASPVAKPTGVAVTAAAIHAALVTLNLISA